MTDGQAERKTTYTMVTFHFMIIIMQNMVMLPKPPPLKVMSCIFRLSYKWQGQTS